MEIFQNSELQEEVRRFCSAQDAERPIAVSLTMKQTRFKPYRTLTDIEAIQNFRHFLNLVNYSFFGKAFQRFRKRLKVVPALEASFLSKRLHYHALMERPAEVDFERFCEIIRGKWARTQWGDRQVHIKPATEPEGWLAYITKQPGTVNTVDWENLVRF